MDAWRSEGLVDHQIDFFDQFAPSYDAWAGALHPRVAQRLVEFTSPRRGLAALDCGTGTGLVAREVAQRVTARGSVIGIDLAEGMLEVARRAPLPALTYIGMAAEGLVFRDATFDLVTMGEALTYFIDPFQALAEARRVLRPKGRIAVSCHRRSLGTEAQDLFFKSLNELALRHHLSVPRHSNERGSFGEPAVLREMLAEAGFRVLSSTDMVTGGRAANAREWTELMAGAGPVPFTLIRVLGPQLRQEFEDWLDDANADLGEEGFRYHHAFSFALAEVG